MHKKRIVDLANELIEELLSCDDIDFVDLVIGAVASADYLDYEETADEENE